MIDRMIEVKPGVFVDLVVLNGFIFRAKQATYASGGGLVTEDRVWIPGNIEHEYQETLPDGTVLCYRDSFCGYLSAPGREFVKLGGEKGLTIWSMSYDGGMVGSNRILSEDNVEFAHKVFGLLKDALVNVPEEIPFRGPLIHESDKYPDLVYECHLFGSDIDNFSGDELIKSKAGFDGRVFHQRFSGGIVIYKK